MGGSVGRQALSDGVMEGVRNFGAYLKLGFGDLDFLPPFPTGLRIRTKKCLYDDRSGSKGTGEGKWNRE